MHSITGTNQGGIISIEVILALTLLTVVLLAHTNLLALKLNLFSHNRPDNKPILKCTDSQPLFDSVIVSCPTSTAVEHLLFVEP